MDNLLNQAIDLARVAGYEVMKIYKRGFTEHGKEDGSPVTEADLASNKIILQGLKKTGIAILSEETKPEEEWFKENKVWMVDPLDGTRDFVQKTGEFSIMIGLVVNKEPVLGVVFQPITNTLYFAEKGKGSFIQKGSDAPKEIRVSDISEFIKAKIVLSNNHTSEAQKDFVKFAKFGVVDNVGSAGLKIGIVASGFAEVYLTESNKIHQWDTAAGECILNEAGGVITDIYGKKLIYCKKSTNHKNGILACNKALHNKIVQLVSSSGLFLF